jgi:hypothetical protein
MAHWTTTARETEEMVGGLNRPLQEPKSRLNTYLLLWLRYFAPNFILHKWRSITPYCDKSGDYMDTKWICMTVPCTSCDILCIVVMTSEILALKSTTLTESCMSD